jgi:transcriptional regulator NrdR family protein
MICPNCGVDDQQKIISTRHRSPEYILRRRECVCGHRFNSVEIIALTEKNLGVIEREMNRNTNGARSFAESINLAYRKIFDRYQYLKEKYHDGARTA